MNVIEPELSHKGGKPRKATTLKRVADEAGVSITAVSKVLHGRGQSVRVSDETADHIREVAQKLNYVPNSLARSLRTNKTDTVGLVFENFGDIAEGPHYYLHLLDGIASEIFKNHFRLTLLAEVDPLNPLSSLADGRLDGVIWCKLAGSPELIRQIANSPIPVVALHAPPVEMAHSTVFVTCDNPGGSRLVVDHLSELGHEKILFVLETGEEHTPDALARLQGFKTSMSDLGREVTEDDIVVWSGKAKEVPSWLAKKTGHTAIYCWNEFLAGNVIKQLQECGRKVPKDYSVVGFDSTPFCETTTPRLTAVRQPIHAMAGQAAKVLMDLINGSKPSQLHQVFSCTLDVRDSTGFAPILASVQRNNHVS